MSASRRALLWLITTDREWLDTFEVFCKRGALRLRSQAWQFRDELRDRGHQFSIGQIEDTHSGLAHDLLPDSLAARQDLEPVREHSGLDGREGAA